MNGVEQQERPLSAFAPRRRPSQERSRRRYDTVLAAARTELVEAGFESFTCIGVAARAGVPIGSVYQFFANKYAIVCELDRVDLIAVLAEIDALGQEIPSLEWTTLVERLVDRLAWLWRRDPSRRAVWMALQLTPTTREVAAAHEREVALRVTELLAPLTPGAPVSWRAEIAQVLVQVTYSVLGYSIRDGLEHDSAVEQLKLLLTSYLLATERQARAADAVG